MQGQIIDTEKSNSNALMALLDGIRVPLLTFALPSLTLSVLQVSAFEACVTWLLHVLEVTECFVLAYF